MEMIKSIVTVRYDPEGSGDLSELDRQNIFDEIEKFVSDMPMQRVLYHGISISISITPLKTDLFFQQGPAESYQ